MSGRSLFTENAAPKVRTAAPVSALLRPRKCGCSGSAGHGTECEECKNKERKCQVAGGTAGSAAKTDSFGASLEGGARSEAHFGHDFSSVRVQSQEEGQSLRFVPEQRDSPFLAAGQGDIEERTKHLKSHNFLCPPVADSLTNISKLGGGGGTLGLTKIDQSSNLFCTPKWDINAQKGTCSFKAVAPTLSITSKFPSVTPEAITSDSLPVPGCGDKPVPVFGKVTQAVSDLAKQGEQEHCDDLTISFNQTLKPCAAAVNKLAGHVFSGKTEDECFKALTASLGFDPISCNEEFLNLTAKDDERDKSGMHDFDFDLISKDCTKIVAGYKKASTNKVGDPSVAPAKFIPASSKCGKAAPAAPAAPAPKSGGSAAPPTAPVPAPKKDKDGG